MPELIHGTAIAVAGKAVLIRGPSGSGKSDLALRCVAAAPGAIASGPALLVADDQVLASRNGERLIVRSPDTIRGRMEVRGVGLVEVPFVAEAELVLVVDLVPPGTLARMPEPKPPAEIAGTLVPCVELDATEASAPFKLFLLMRPLLGSA
ncbi:MAG TPA: aldolase [Hyphomicrobiaceae bacterium]|nr:aldolase [Hyphomicrobiaceae bacterium]